MKAATMKTFLAGLAVGVGAGVAVMAGVAVWIVISVAAAVTVIGSLVAMAVKIAGDLDRREIERIERESESDGE